MHVNAFHTPSDAGHKPLALAVEEVLDATKRTEAGGRRGRIRARCAAAFYVYDDGEARDFVSMCNLPARRGRVAVPRSRWKPALTLGEYPITIAL